uniref:E3 UFM1-protein ligase 1 n=1 Tax=Gadus morhua TaxID=8049 RepID=A0A8C4ZY16_GADMO
MDDAWDEIRRLAADLQTAQFAQTVQRLSERNCIEIITKLVQEKRLDVVHTLDGKEYITPAQITQEVRDELYIQGGRINMVDLQQIINVDLNHIEARANEITRTERGIQLVLGQLIDVKYLERLAEEVNDKLQEAGLITISELCKTYDLPGDFLTEELSRRMGKLVQGQFDQYNRGVIYTPAFVARHKARIRGLFSAVTSNAVTRPSTGPPPRLARVLTCVCVCVCVCVGVCVAAVLEELVNSGRLKGAVVGGRQDKAVYIPDIYSRTQNNWVDSFLQQNGYLEFDALVRLGIPEPAAFIRKRFRSGRLLFLRAAAVGPGLVDQLEASVEEAVSSSTWVDLQPMLPSSLSQEDVGMLVSQALRNAGVTTSARVLGDSVVVSEKFISGCLALFDDAMQMKAHKGSGSVKGGGGGNAREFKIRKTKKKGRRDEDSDEETGPPSQTGETPPPRQVRPPLPDRPLSKAYQEVVRSVFLSSSSSPSGANKKKSMKELQEEVTNLYNNIRLFEKGAKLLPEETQVHATRHVLKTLCTDVTNALVNFLAADLMMSMDQMTSGEEPSLSGEVRAKILGKLPEETRAPLMKLHHSLSGKSIEDFLNNVETAAEACGLLLKKGDKKRERQSLFVHRNALLEQLKQTEDPALVLHLTSVLLFQGATHCILHAPGRCVPGVISTLSGRIPTESHQLLSQYQGLVVKQLNQGRKKTEKEDEEEKEEEEKEKEEDIRGELLSLMPQVKNLVLVQRKTSVGED